MTASDTTRQAPANGRQFWRPPSDDELSWFRPPEGIVPTRPRPLEATLTTHAFGFGLHHGLISLYFPLSEVRARVFDGALYLASLPSPLADRDLTAQLRRARDSSIRFTNNIKGAWERVGRPEVEGYNTSLASFAGPDASDADVAAGLNQLRRDRGNQWFIGVRMAVATPALLRARGDDFPREDAAAVIRSARELVVQGGAAELEGAIGRVGERLVKRGLLDAADEVYWLELDEVSSALDQGGDQRTVVQARRAAWDPDKRVPDSLGPALPPDAPRMYLLREILDLLAGSDL